MPRRVSFCATSASARISSIASIRRYGPEIMDEPVFRSMSHWMLQQDPPDHTRLRGLVVKAFTARRVEDMRPRIQQIVDDTLDAIAGQGHMDLIEDFAFRLPVTIICDMLGIPEEHREAVLQELARRRPPARSGAADAGRDRAGQCRQRDGPDVFPAVVRTAPAQPGRRSDDATGAGRGRRQQALQRGVDRQHHPAVRRRARDHRQSDRQRATGAAPQSRSACAAQVQARRSSPTPSRNSCVTIPRCR